MGFCAGAKDEVMSNRATFGTAGKFAQLAADLTPGVIGKKCKQAPKRSAHTRGGVKAAEANGS